MDITLKTSPITIQIFHLGKSREVYKNQHLLSLYLGLICHSTLKCTATTLPSSGGKLAQALYLPIQGPCPLFDYFSKANNLI